MWLAAVLLSLAITEVAPTVNSSCAAAYDGAACTPRPLACFGTGFSGELTVSQSHPFPKSLSNVQALFARAGSKVSTATARNRLPPTPPWGKRTMRSSPFTTCALVGNSPVLTKKGGPQYGEEIDTHQLVMRINNAPTVGFETFAGTKTNLRYQNERYMGFREFSSDVLIGRFCHRFDALSHSPSKSLKGGHFKHDCTDDKGDKGGVLLKMLKKKIHPVNDEFDQWITRPFRTKGIEPSSGMRALAIMLHVCKTVDLYGFRGVTGFRSWYWEKYKGFQGKPPQDVIDKKFPHILDADKSRVAEWAAPMSAAMKATQRAADQAAAGGVQPVSARSAAAGETVVVVGRRQTVQGLQVGAAAATAAQKPATAPARVSPLERRQRAIAATVKAAQVARAAGATAAATPVTARVRVGATGQGQVNAAMSFGRPKTQPAAVADVISVTPPRFPSFVKPQAGFHSVPARHLLVSTSHLASHSSPSHSARSSSSHASSSRASTFKQKDRSKADVSTHDEHIEEKCFQDLEALGLIRTHS